MNRHQIEKPRAAKPGRPPRTAIVVLGMHRSGTSALARVVNLLGAALPSALLPPAPGNEKGHWEPAKVAALHDEILASVGSQWHAPTGPAEIWFLSPQANAYVARIKEAILSEYGEAPLFVVKDPRLSLLFPLWSRAFAELGIACKAIVAIRNQWRSRDLSTGAKAKRIPTTSGMSIAAG